MQTILDLLGTLNAAIDAGTMTQEVIAFAALAISHQVLADWRAGTLTRDELHQICEKMERLSFRWEIFQQTRMGATGITRQSSSTNHEVMECGSESAKAVLLLRASSGRG